MTDNAILLWRKNERLEEEDEKNDDLNIHRNTIWNVSSEEEVENAVIIVVFVDDRTIRFVCRC